MNAKPRRGDTGFALILRSNFRLKRIASERNWKEHIIWSLANLKKVQEEPKEIVEILSLCCVLKMMRSTHSLLHKVLTGRLHFVPVVENQFRSFRQACTFHINENAFFRLFDHPASPAAQRLGRDRLERNYYGD